MEDEIKHLNEMKALHSQHVKVLEEHITFLRKTVASQIETIEIQTEIIRLLKAANTPPAIPAFNTRDVGIA